MQERELEHLTAQRRADVEALSRRTAPRHSPLRTHLLCSSLSACPPRTLDQGPGALCRMGPTVSLASITRGKHKQRGIRWPRSRSLPLCSPRHRAASSSLHPVLAQTCPSIASSRLQVIEARPRCSSLLTGRRTEPSLLRSAAGRLDFRPPPFRSPLSRLLICPSPFHHSTPKPHPRDAMPKSQARLLNTAGLKDRNVRHLSCEGVRISLSLSTLCGSLDVLTDCRLTVPQAQDEGALGSRAELTTPTRADPSPAAADSARERCRALGARCAVPNACGSTASRRASQLSTPALRADCLADLPSHPPSLDAGLACCSRRSKSRGPRSCASKRSSSSSRRSSRSETAVLSPSRLS